MICEVVTPISAISESFLAAAPRRGAAGGITFPLFVDVDVDGVTALLERVARRLVGSTLAFYTVIQTYEDFGMSYVS
jgi:hypothetical protein